MTALPSLLFSEHHRSHAASAFFPSPFKEAAVVCMDGVGEWATTSVWIGQDNKLIPQWEIDFPHSLGLLYSALNYFTGFKVNEQKSLQPRIESRSGISLLHAYRTVRK